VTALVLIPLGATPARAQLAALGSDSVRVGGDTVAKARRPAPPWFSHGDALLFGGALGATAVLVPLDRTISDEFAEPHWRQSRRVRRVAKGVAFFGGDGPFAVSVLLAGSTLGDLPGVRGFAVHEIEALALATGITGVGKGVTGRALPGVATKHAFEFGRGFHDRNGPFVAFPSGHTASAFATATTIVEEIGGADSSRSRLVAVIAFGGATAVGVARVVQRVHWPTDLPTAAFIGIWSGETVHRHAGGSGVAGALVRGIAVAPGRGRGVQVGWSSLAAAAR
jgi:membrane-associated phospholipid phosphatase